MNARGWPAATSKTGVLKWHKRSWGTGTNRTAVGRCKRAAFQNRFALEEVRVAPRVSFCQVCAGGAGSGALGGFFHAERDSLSALGNEEGFSTVQSGVHFRFDVDKGLQMGRTIAAKALQQRDLDDIIEALTRP